MKDYWHWVSLHNNRSWINIWKCQAYFYLYILYSISNRSLIYETWENYLVFHTTTSFSESTVLRVTSADWNWLECSCVNTNNVIVFCIFLAWCWCRQCYILYLIWCLWLNFATIITISFFIRSYFIITFVYVFNKFTVKEGMQWLRWNTSYLVSTQSQSNW